MKAQEYPIKNLKGFVFYICVNNLSWLLLGVWLKFPTSRILHLLPLKKLSAPNKSSGIHFKKIVEIINHLLNIEPKGLHSSLRYRYIYIFVKKK